MEAISEVSGDPQAAGQPAGGCLTPQNLPASVSQTIVDKQPQSGEEDEVICLLGHWAGFQWLSVFRLWCFLFLLLAIMLCAF